MSATHALITLTALFVVACGSGGAGAHVDASPPVACDVPGGACAQGQLCVHVCDCCGVPQDDGGVPSAGHHLCVDDTGQCAGGGGTGFQIEDVPNSCWCQGGPGVIECPCA